MLKLRSFEVPQRFVFVDPDTGKRYLAPTEQSLVSQIVSYRAQNELEEIKHLSNVLQNYWCTLPENKGKCQTMPLRRGFMQYLKGGIALLENIFVPEKSRVSQEEANRRASICVTCPYNVFPDKAGFVKWSDQIAEASIGELKTTLHDKLGNCDICSCVLKVKVWVKDPKPEEAEAKKMMHCLPDGGSCWQLKAQSQKG